MRILFYALIVALLVLWGGTILPRSVGAGSDSGLRVVRMRAPLLEIWTPEAARRLPSRARKGPPVAVLAPALVTKPGRTVVLESAPAARGAPPAVVARVVATPVAPGPRHQAPKTVSRPPAVAIPPPPCRRLVAIVHRSWAVALAHRFGVAAATIVKRPYDVRLYRVALLLPNAQAPMALEQRLHRLGFPRPYFRHHGGQAELSLGVFLARGAARSLVQRLASNGLRASLEVFVRPWTTYELVVHVRALGLAGLRRAYPGVRALGCPP